MRTRRAFLKSSIFGLGFMYGIGISKSLLEPDEVDMTSQAQWVQPQIDVVPDVVVSLNKYREAVRTG